MDFLSLDCFDEFTARFILSKVNKLVGKCGIRESDREDLIQDFVRDLLNRSKNFDPKTGTWEAFVVVVCENFFATILEHQRAEMRVADYEAGSLNSEVKGPDGEPTELGDTLPGSEPSLRTRRHQRHHEEAFDLADDVKSVLKLLKPEARKLCLGVMISSITQVAEDLGVSRQTVYRRLKKLLSRFEKEGLRDYLSK